MQEKVKSIKKKTKWLFRRRTIYVIIGLFFSTWILFCDNNSYLRHQQLNDEINQLNQQKNFLKERIEEDKKSLKEFDTREGKVKFGREQYYFKKENEDIFVIEYDTIEK